MDIEETTEHACEYQLEGGRSYYYCECGKTLEIETLFGAWQLNGILMEELNESGKVMLNARKHIEVYLKTIIAANDEFKICLVCGSKSFHEDGCIIKENEGTIRSWNHEKVRQLDSGAK